jgi:glutamate-1-semialdehyde 2,1-aminomutase
VAAVMLEPVAGNMGCVPPRPGYLEGLRDLTSRYGALLIFDEVMTGFRVAYGGAQALYGVTPDITVLGKVIGGGLPVAAYGARAELMDQIAPAGPIYQAGTLSGNPLAMSAGIVMLRILRDGAIYEQLEAISARLATGLGDAAREAGIPVYQTRVGSMQGLFFQEGPVWNEEDARRSDTARYGRFFHGMLENGVYLAPSQFEVVFLSAAHSPADIEQTIAAARRVFAQERSL